MEYFLTSEEQDAYIEWHAYEKKECFNKISKLINPALIKDNPGIVNDLAKCIAISYIEEYPKEEANRIFDYMDLNWRDIGFIMEYNMKEDFVKHLIDERDHFDEDMLNIYEAY